MMGAWVRQSVGHKGTVDGVGEVSATAGAALIVQGSFSAKRSEKKRTFEVFIGGTFWSTHGFRMP